MMLNNNQPRLRLQNLNRIILLCFILVGLGLVYWSVFRSEPVLAREDNPRLVERELRIERGRILDISDVALARSQGPPGQLQRVYPLANVGPAVGYYTFRHGTAGIEAGLDDVLRGENQDVWADFRHRLLHQPQVGRDVRLTLDARWQQVAETILGQRHGAILLLSLPDAAVRAMVSHPAYDPNRLDELFDSLAADASAPLLNRVTQGNYQPGQALQPFVLAAALDQGAISLDAAVEAPNRPVIINGTELTCVSPPPNDATWAGVLSHSCPAPMQELASTAGVDIFQAAIASFGFGQPPTLPIATDTLADEPVEDLFLALIGQENLTVSPLEMGLALAALANNGQRPQPQLVAAVQNRSGEWQAYQPAGARQNNEPAVSPGTAQAILAAMGRHEGFIEHAALAIAGPEEAMNAWYMALAPAEQPRFAVVVIVEDAASVQETRAVGRGLLQTILSRN